MSKPPYRVLRIILGFLSLLLVLAGLLLMILVHSDTLASQKRPSPPTHPRRHHRHRHAKWWEAYHWP
jgi:hypothetical protein